MIVDIKEFKHDDNLGINLQVWIIIKGFHQDKIVKKIVQRRGDRSWGLTSLNNTKNRKYSKGLVALVSFQSNFIRTEDINLSKNRIECLEPFEMDTKNNFIAIATGSEILLINTESKSRKRIHSEWMSFLHSVEFSKDVSKILVSSAGYDTISELDLQKNKVIWDWNTWENGFHYSPRSNGFITKNDWFYQYLESIVNKETHVSLINDPRRYPSEGVPTYESPTRLNSAHYGMRDEILATCYHRPELLVIKKNKFFRQFNFELKHPHSFRLISIENENKYMVTDSGRGRIIVLDKNFKLCVIYDFSKISVISSVKKQFGEWLQSTTFIKLGKSYLFVSVDALRNGIHIIDPVEQKRRFISTSPQWSIQSIFYTASLQTHGRLQEKSKSNDSR